MVKGGGGGGVLRLLVASTCMPACRIKNVWNQTAARPALVAAAAADKKLVMTIACLH